MIIEVIWTAASAIGLIITGFTLYDVDKDHREVVASGANGALQLQGQQAVNTQKLIFVKQTIMLGVGLLALLPVSDRPGISTVTIVGLLLIAILTTGLSVLTRLHRIKLHRRIREDLLKGA